MTRVLASDIKQAAAKVHNLPVESLEGPRTFRHFAQPRQRAMYAVRKLRPDMSLARIGMAFGGRDHTTVRHAVQRVEERMADCPDEREAVEAIFAAVSAS